MAHQIFDRGYIFNMNYLPLENRINEAIGVREKGNLRKSRFLFESILKDINKLLQKDPSKELKNIYATAMGEYVIQHRLEAGALYRNALELGEDLLKYDRENKLNNPLSIRAVSNTLLNLGAFEKAEEYLRQLLPLYEENSAQIGDTKAHISYCYFRTGRVNEASKLVDEAIEDIKENSAKKKYFSVWLSHALLVKSLILNSEKKVKEALEYAKESLKVAEKGGIKVRINQSKEVIDYLQNKLRGDN